MLTNPQGIVKLTISEPHNRSTLSSLYYQAIIWAHVTSCHSRNAGRVESWRGS